MSSEVLIIYSITIFVASIIPGPSMLLALTHGMKYGAKKTVASAFGNLSVTILQAAVSIAGLGAVLLASENLFNLIKWIGALYLIHMGIGVLRSSAVNIKGVETGRETMDVPLMKMYMQAAFVTAGNPKAIVFFTAVFPQFINPQNAFIPQFVILMGLVVIIAFSCFMIYAVCGEKIVAVFSDASVGRTINRILGASFIAAGIGLAMSRR